MTNTQDQLFAVEHEGPRDNEALQLDVQYRFIGRENHYQTLWCLSNPVLDTRIIGGSNTLTKTTGWQLTEGGMLISRFGLLPRYLNPF